MITVEELCALETAVNFWKSESGADCNDETRIDMNSAINKLKEELSEEELSDYVSPDEAMAKAIRDFLGL